MNIKKCLSHRMWLYFAITLFSLLFSSEMRAQEEYGVEPVLADVSDSASMAGTEISLVTCEPFSKIYSLYGHTGIRVHDSARGIDILANWGIFEMRKKYFMVRFTFGLTDYKMEIEPWDGFCGRYLSYGSGVQEQVLNLTNTEKAKLIAAIMENYKPENRYYRYNYFYDNCTTRVRDIIEQSIDGDIKYPISKDPKSFRELIHEYNEDHLWARWGNDLLLGVKADKKTTNEEAHFLPYNLFRDFGAAKIYKSGKETRVLVKETRWAVPPMYVKGTNDFLDYLLSPIGVVLLYFLVYKIIIGIEKKRNIRIWQFDSFVLLFTGIIGLVLFAMIFSQHPTVSLNFQILIFNPLSLVMLWPIIKSLRRGEPSRLLYSLGIMVAIGILLGVFFQKFADGVIPLALFLLTTYARGAGLTKNEKK